MGVLDSSDGGSGYVAINTVQSTIETLKGMYPTFGGVFGWEYFDAGNTDGDAQPYQWVASIREALYGTIASKKRMFVRTRSRREIMRERIS